MVGHTVTRAQLSESVYEEVGLSRNESAELVESVLDEMIAALARGEMVKISSFGSFSVRQKGRRVGRNPKTGDEVPILRSEEHTSELQSLMRISYAVFCLKKKNNNHKQVKTLI